MSKKPNSAIAVIGIDIGKNPFHIVGHDNRGAIVLPRDPEAGARENAEDRQLLYFATIHSHHANERLVVDFQLD